MKKIFFAMMLVIASLLPIPAIAQAHIVHYDGVGKVSAKRPDFTNTVVAIDFKGPLAATAERMFRNLGVKDFSVAEKGSSCNIAQTIICVRIEVGPGVDVSSSGYSSGYGRNGGSYNQGSFNGQLYSVNVAVSIMRRNPNGSLSVIPIGLSSTLAPAGSSMESIASYGRNGGGAFTASTTGGLDATIGNAIDKDLIDLLGGGWSRVIIASKIRSPWVPGADQEVALSFPKTDASR